MKSGQIQNSQITASSFYPHQSIFHGPTNARLDRPSDGATTGSWSAAVSDGNQWIQADLGTVKDVSGIVLQGSQTNNIWSSLWVTEYKVQYSSDGVTWRYVQDSGRISDMVRSLNDK